MSLTKALHPDEKYKAGKLGSNMMKAGLGVFVLFMIISLVLGSMYGDNWRRFLHAYVVGWSFIVSIAIPPAACCWRARRKHIGALRCRSRLATS